MGGKNPYSQALLLVFQLNFFYISLALVTDADENKLENNLMCLRVEVFATHMKS